MMTECTTTQTLDTWLDEIREDIVNAFWEAFDRQHDEQMQAWEQSRYEDMPDSAYTRYLDENESDWK